jgi:hypothetical protein
MIAKTYTFEKKNVNLYLMGDIHLGFEGCQKDRFKQALELLRKDPNGCFIGMGDYMEAISPMDKRFDMKTRDKDIPMVSDEFMEFWEIMKPVKHKIIGLLAGNHSLKWERQSAFESVKTLCHPSLLDCDFLEYSCLMDIVLLSGGKKKTWRLHVTHGYGGGDTPGATANNLSKQQQKFDADIFAMGHTHKLMDQIEVLLYKEGNKVKQRHIWEVNTGSFFTTYQEGCCSYAELSQKKPLPIGYAIVKLDMQNVIVEKKPL